jgi:hypothetical protein
MVMYLKITFSGKTKQIVFEKSLLEYDALEKRIRSTFQVIDQNIITFYIDDEGVKIVLLQNSDVEAMINSKPDCLVFRISVESNEVMIKKANNSAVLKRMYFEQLRRKYYVHESNDYQEFKNDIGKIRSYLLNSGMDRDAVFEVVDFLNQSTGLQLIDQLMWNEIINNEPNTNSTELNMGGTCDNISISSISKPSEYSKISFMSGTDGVRRHLSNRNSMQGNENPKQENNQLDGNQTENELSEFENLSEISEEVCKKLRASCGFDLQNNANMLRSLQMVKNSGGKSFLQRLKDRVFLSDNFNEGSDMEKNSKLFKKQ